MKNDLVKFDAPELKIIEQSRAEQIKKTFEPMVQMLNGMEEAYNEIVLASKEGIDEELSKRAKRVRIDIGKIRITTEKTRKAEKEEYLRGGKAIDGVANILKWAISDKEDELKKIEDHFDNLERERIQKLQDERVKLLSEYVEDADQRDLTKFEEDEFQALLTLKKKQKEDEIAANKLAEEQRLKKEKEEEEERERIRKENERLKAEADERERLAKIEEEKRAKAEAERLAKEEAERKEREAKELEAKRIHEEELRKERERVEKLEAEAKAKAEAEAKAKAKEEAERLAKELEAKKKAEELAKGPIKNQLNSWIDTFAIEEAPGELQENELAKNIQETFNKFVAWAKKESNNL